MASKIQDALLELASQDPGPCLRGKPYRWWDDPHWRCGNDHVSTMLLRTEEGRFCLACGGDVWLTFPEDQDGPPEWMHHMRRRMFCIHEGLLLAPKNVLYGHKEWMSKMVPDWITLVRGYVYKPDPGRAPGIFFYKGEDYRTDDEVEEAAVKYAPLITLTLKLPPMPVFAGVEPGDPGEQWLPRKFIMFTSLS